MELTQLRYVLAVAEKGNFTRASEGLNISQPSLSQQIINLERELGHKLFHRLGRKAVVTEAGAVFVERARRILFEVETASKELSDHPSLERRITVGAISTVAPFLLPAMIQRCRVRFPNLQVDTKENFTYNLAQAVLEGELDLGIGALPIKDSGGLSIEPLLKEPLLLVVAKDHPLARRPKVTGADLADETFAMLGTSSSLAAQVQSFCGVYNYKPRIGLVCSQVATVKALVAVGAGISILPRVARAPEDDVNLTYIELHGSSPTRELVVFRHLQRYQSRGAEQFLSVLREMALELVSAPAGHTFGSP